MSLQITTTLALFFNKFFTVSAPMPEFPPVIKIVYPDKSINFLQ